MSMVATINSASRSKASGMRIPRAEPTVPPQKCSRGSGSPEGSDSSRLPDARLPLHESRDHHHVVWVRCVAQAQTLCRAEVRTGSSPALHRRLPCEEARARIPRAAHAEAMQQLRVQDVSRDQETGSDNGCCSFEKLGPRDGAGGAEKKQATRGESGNSSVVVLAVPRHD